VIKLSKEEVEVEITYQGINKKIKGNVNLVLREIIKFFSEIIPSLEIITKLSLTVDLEELLKICQEILAITEEGIVILVPIEKLTDRDLILLYLAKSRIAYYLGRSDRDTMFISDLLSETKRSAGTIAGRLSELTYEGIVDRVGKGEYRITTLGLDHFKKEVLYKLKNEVK